MLSGMRMVLCALLLAACGGSVEPGEATATDGCDGICSVNATCNRDASGTVTECLCEPDYQGDGFTCEPG